MVRRPTSSSSPSTCWTTLAILFLIHLLGRQWSDPLRARLGDRSPVRRLRPAVAVYFLDSIDDYQLRIVDLRPLDRIVSILLVGLVLEAVRRTVGWSLIVIVPLRVHALTADRFPGVFFGPPISFDLLLQTLLFGDTGLFGIPIFVMAQYIVLFCCSAACCSRPAPAPSSPALPLRCSTSGRRAGQGRRRVVRPVRHRVGERGEQRSPPAPSPSR